VDGGCCIHRLQSWTHTVWTWRRQIHKRKLVDEQRWVFTKQGWSNERTGWIMGIFGASVIIKTKGQDTTASAAF